MLVFIIALAIIFFFLFLLFLELDMGLPGDVIERIVAAVWNLLSNDGFRHNVND